MTAFSVCLFFCAHPRHTNDQQLVIRFTPSNAISLIPSCNPQQVTRVSQNKPPKGVTGCIHPTNHLVRPSLRFILYQAYAWCSTALNLVVGLFHTKNIPGRGSSAGGWHESSWYEGRWAGTSTAAQKSSDQSLLNHPGRNRQLTKHHKLHHHDNKAAFVSKLPTFSQDVVCLCNESPIVTAAS